jgi:predicted nuclease of predicted toxin-antitoxin system
VRFKLNENIGERGANLLRLAGHDVATVREQELLGTTDENLFAVCAAESRALITLDHDFGHVLRFPPSKSAGIVILETTPRAEADTVLARVRDLITVLQDRQLTSDLWIIEPGRLRIHQSNDD